MENFIKNVDIAHDAANSGKPLRYAARADGVTEERKHFLDTEAARVENTVENALNPFGIQELRKMFGENFYGPEKVEEKIGIKISPEDMPPMPPQEKVMKAEKLGMVCILRVYESGKPAEWKFIMPNILPETSNTDYIKQTIAIRDFLNNHGLLSTDELEECTDEKLDKLKQALNENPEVISSIIKLKINQNHRNSQVDISYYAVIMSQTNRVGAINSPAYLSGDTNTTCPKFGSIFEATNETMYDSYGEKKGEKIILVGRFEDNRSFQKKYPSQEMKSGVRDFMYPTLQANRSVPQSWAGSYNQGVRVVI